MCLNNIPAKKLWIEENTVLINQAQVKSKKIAEATVLFLAYPKVKTIIQSYLKERQPTIPNYQEVYLKHIFKNP